jgi:hypothetical protein
MPSLDIKLDPSIHPDGDGCWSDLKERPFEHGLLVGIAALEAGMVTGRPSVMLRVETDDGRVILAETSLRLLSAAVRAFVARYGDPHAGDA